jgi:hypothetical protein
VQKTHEFYFIWRKNSVFKILYQEIVKEFRLKNYSEV